MPTSSLQISGEVGGINIAATVQRSHVGQIGHDLGGSLPELPAAESGTLSTRTSDTAGVATLGAGHAVQLNDVVSVFWTENGVEGRRYGVDVTLVNGNDVTFSGGAGDNLPSQSTALTVSIETVIDTDFDGDLVAAIAAKCAQRGVLRFLNAGAEQLVVDLAAAEIWHWLENSGFANPLASKTVTDAGATQADATQTARLQVGIGYDSV